MTCTRLPRTFMPCPPFLALPSEKTHGPARAAFMPRSIEAGVVTPELLSHRLDRFDRRGRCTTSANTFTPLLPVGHRLGGRPPHSSPPRPLDVLQAGGQPADHPPLRHPAPGAAPVPRLRALPVGVNIRAAAVLGFVGAGGLGQRIHIAISLFLG